MRAISLALGLLALPVLGSGAQSGGRERRVDVKAADYALILPDTIRAGPIGGLSSTTG